MLKLANGLNRSRKKRRRKSNETDCQVYKVAVQTCVYVRVVLKVKVKEQIRRMLVAVKSHKKQAAVIGTCIIIIIGVTVALSLATCSSNSNKRHDGVTENNIDGFSFERFNKIRETGATDAGDSNDGSQDEVGENKDNTQEQIDALTEQSSEFSNLGQDAGKGSTPDGSASNNIPNDDSSTNNVNAPQAPTTPEKHWVVDYEQVWVEDSPAWIEQVPIYGYEEQSVCNICNQVITNNEVAHGKAHMQAGEGSGHHTEYKQVVTGYNTVGHPAEGHYTTVESGGHWE